jgi:hypothetical protein
VALAGPAAQARVFPGSIKEKNISDDKMRALSEAIRIAHIRADMPAPRQTGEISISREMLDEATSVLRHLEDETSALVVENWPAIERVADALMHRDVLLQADLDALIADKPMIKF